MPSPNIPDDGELQLGTVRLPAGRRVFAHLESGGPVAWATEQPVPDPGRTWQALSDLAPQTGLVPFLLSGLDKTTRRPWDEHEFIDPVDVGSLDQMDAGVILAELWSGEFEEDEFEEEEPPSTLTMNSFRQALGMPSRDFSDFDDEDDETDEDYGDDEYEDDDFAAMIAPFSRTFPGLAPPEDQAISEQEARRLIDSLSPARIGLAAASRPADVLPVIGSAGAANYWEDALVIAAVLRSWEDRFGARLLRVGFAEIQLLARRPPRTEHAAQLLAAEQFAFCDECAGKGLHDVSSIAEHLLRSPVWTFWWD